MLSKLFKRKGKPTKHGKVESSHSVRVYKLELTNMEDSPTYDLTENLTIGSELGDIVLEDPSISPRHCSFTLKEEVVSIIDHGSVAGTFVNEKKITPGRYVILEESDVISVGDLQVKLDVTVEKVAAPVEVEEEEEDEEEEEEVPELKLETKKPAYLSKNKEGKYSKKKKTAKSAGGFTNNYSTNALVRVISVVLDLFLAYALFVVFYPFDEYRIFLDDLPAQIGALLDVDWKHLWGSVMEDYGAIGTIIEEGYQYISSTIDVYSIIVNFFILRLLSTLVFGASISEVMLGVRGLGNGIWKRIGGMLRVCIGMITWPFILFDVPAIISRRTLKEYITFTHTYISSVFYTILGFIVYIPLVLAILLVSPLFQGLELPEPILVNDRLEQRVKVVAQPKVETPVPAPAVGPDGTPIPNAPAPNAPATATTPAPADVPIAAPVEITEVRDTSDLYRLEISYDSSAVTLMPDFKFQGQGSKMTYTPYMTVYQRELQRSVRFEVYKKFNMRELLSVGIGGNYFLFDKFPEIYNFVYSSDQTKGSHSKIQDKVLKQFADEVVAFTKLSFELTMDNAPDIMLTYSPLLKSLMDYKATFLGLIEYKDMESITFQKLGSTYFLKFSTTNKQKPFDIFVPLLPHQDGILYKVEYDKRENLGALSNQFYKFTLDSTGWLPENHGQVESETFTPFQVLDFFTKLNLKNPKIQPKRAQAIYGHYFERSAEILKRGDEQEISAWKSSVEAIFKIIERVSEVQEPKPAPVVAPTTAETPAAPDGTQLPPAVAPQVEEPDPREKLKQNFQDLKNAVDAKDKTYFGLEQNTSI